MSKRTAGAETVEVLAQGGHPGGRATRRAYPHQLSGGMRQRVMIAMALPASRVADCRRADHGAGRDRAGPDPRTIKTLQGNSHGFILITHDLGRGGRGSGRGGRHVRRRIVERLPQRTSATSLRSLHAGPAGVDTAHGKEASGRNEPSAAPRRHPFSMPAGCMFAPRCPYSSPHDGPSRTVRPELLPAALAGITRRRGHSHRSSGNRSRAAPLPKRGRAGASPRRIGPPGAVPGTT